MSHKKTPKEFVEELKNKRGNEFTVLTNYEKSTVKVKVRHNKCGYEYYVNPFNLLNGSKCPHCSLAKRRKAPKQFANELKNLVGNEYTLLTPYKNSRTLITIRHNKCNYVYNIRPDRFLKGDRCPKCSKNAMRTTSWFKKELYKKYKNEYVVLGNYRGINVPIEVKHTVCDHTYSPTPSNLLNDRSHCPYCSALILRSKESLGLNKVKSIINKNSHGTIEVLSKQYNNLKEPIRVKCKKCGNIWETLAGNLVNGKSGCPNCANIATGNRSRLTISQVKSKIIKVTNNEYVFVGNKYKNSNLPIKVKHKKCGTIFEVTLNHFLSSRSRCPKCGASNGEKQVQDYLDSYKVNYKYGYIIPDLVYKKNLHFDFWLPQYKLAIEYDGQQHFYPVQFGGMSEEQANQEYKDGRLRDSMKDVYCKENNIKLIRIKYDQDVDTVLNKGLLPLLPVESKKDHIEFKKVPVQDTYDMMVNYHYIHRRVVTKYTYGLYADEELVGFIAYSPVRKSTAHAISNEATKDNTLELSRLFIKDNISQTHKNITSEFVSYTLRDLKKKGNWYIISYADGGMNHVGAIYQATNFLYCGTTKHREYSWNGYGKHGGQWIKGHYYRYMIVSSKKYRYIMFVGNKGFKKQAKKGLKYDTEPYPKGENTHYSVGDTEERLIRDRETGKIWKESELVKHLKKIKRD